MFDPTAFDNMKVVVEGALYDLDLAGEILIINRNDMMNLAKLSRSFDVSFRLREPGFTDVTAKFGIESTLMNLAAELIPNSLSENNAGCKIKLKFYHEGITDITHLENIRLTLTEIWGDRKIIQSVTAVSSDSTIKNGIDVEFDRLIGEEQMDDLVEMIDFMVTTIQHLQIYLNKINND